MSYSRYMDYIRTMTDVMLDKEYKIVKKRRDAWPINSRPWRAWNAMLSAVNSELMRRTSR